MCPSEQLKQPCYCFAETFDLFFGARAYCDIAQTNECFSPEFVDFYEEKKQNQLFNSDFKVYYNF